MPSTGALAQKNFGKTQSIAGRREGQVGGKCNTFEPGTAFTRNLPHKNAVAGRSEAASSAGDMQWAVHSRTLLKQSWHTPRTPYLNRAGFTPAPYLSRAGRLPAPSRTPHRRTLATPLAPHRYVKWVRRLCFRSTRLHPFQAHQSRFHEFSRSGKVAGPDLSLNSGAVRHPCVLHQMPPKMVKVAAVWQTKSTDMSSKV